MFNLIKEEKTNLGNGETVVAKGVYFNTISKEYTWMTFTKSGSCKKLETAMRKAGF